MVPLAPLVRLITHPPQHQRRVTGTGCNLHDQAVKRQPVVEALQSLTPLLKVSKVWFWFRRDVRRGKAGVSAVFFA